MNARRLPSLARFTTLLLAALTVALVGGLLVAASPAQAVKPKNDHARMPRDCATPKELIPPEPTVCHLNTFEDDRPTVLLWGDSHAWMMIPALQSAARGKDVNLVAIVLGGCPPMDNQVKSTAQAPSCFRSNALALEWIADYRSGGEELRVVLGGSWGRYRQALRARDGSYTEEMARRMVKATPRLMKTLAKRGVATDVVGQVAVVPEKRKACPKGERPYACDVARRSSLPDEKGTKKWLNKTIRPLAGNRAPININGFCTKTVCHGKVGKVYTWWDDLHISATMSRKVRRVLVPTVEKVIEASEPEPEPQPCPIPILC